MVCAPHYIIESRRLEINGGKVALLRKPEEKVHLGDFDVDGRRTLNGF